jgi:hypothetical protein
MSPYFDFGDTVEFVTDKPKAKSHPVQRIKLMLQSCEEQ